MLLRAYQWILSLVRKWAKKPIICTDLAEDFKERSQRTRRRKMRIAGLEPPGAPVDFWPIIYGPVCPIRGKRYAMVHVRNGAPLLQLYEDQLEHIQSFVEFIKKKEEASK